MNTWYYWELENTRGEFRETNDAQAVARMRKMANGEPVMALYKESDTDDGTPFIMLLEESQKTVK